MQGLHVTCEGTLVVAPTLQYVSNGTAILRFDLAVAENETETTVCRVTCFADLAIRLAGVLQKDQRIDVAGKLKLATLTDSDGTKRHVLAVNAADVRLLGAVGHRSPRRSDDRMSDAVRSSRT